MQIRQRCWKWAAAVLAKRKPMDMGGSLAIVGATAVAEAFQKHNGDFEAAFQDYNDSLRTFVENVQLNRTIP